MPILQIEHPVPDFAAYKDAFDRDPVNRAQSGVRRYRVLRPINDPQYVIVDLEFDNVGEAEAFLAALRELWRPVQGTITPRTRIVEVLEDKALSREGGRSHPARARPTRCSPTRIGLA